MDIRAAIPPTLPRSNPTPSYWQTPPSELATYRSTPDLPNTIDVIVVGSGISGAFIAWNLLEHDSRIRILMLEARTVCSGATGRNGGHTKAASYRHFAANTETFGLAEAVKIVRLEYATILATHSFAKEHGISCDLFDGLTVDIIYDKSQWENALRGIGSMREAMPDDLEGAAKYEIFSESEAREMFHVKGKARIYGAIRYQAGGLSAYKFVCGVLSLCLARGLQLHAETAVLALEKTNDSLWKAKTERGNVIAGKVVVATNGYTGFLLPRMRGSIVPLRGQITAHRPGSHMPKGGLATTYSFIYGDGYEYMVPRPQGSANEGDIVIGGGLAKAAQGGLLEYGTTDDTHLEPNISAHLHESTPRIFGEECWGEDHPDGRIRMEWTGIMGYSPDGLPFVGEMPGEDNLYISASFQGHGMVLCVLCAKAVALMMTGRSMEELGSWFPETFKVTEARMKLKFKGRLHVKAAE